MEAVGEFFEEEWESLSRMFTTEEANFLVQQLHGHEECGGLSFETSPLFWPSDEANITNAVALDQNLFDSSTNINSNFQYYSQDSSSNNSLGSNNEMFFPAPIYENYHLNLIDTNHMSVLNNVYESIDFYTMVNDEKISSNICGGIMEDLKDGTNIGDIQLSNADPSEQPQLKRKLDVAEVHTDNATMKSKKARVSSDINMKKSNKNAQGGKSQKVISANVNDCDESNGRGNRQSSSSYSSEDDSNNASQELNGEASLDTKALNKTGKTKASRGSATDPQSLYARKRRERINERLRILQNLVPNGTKVDISTMLEEAVHYVKFLQLQIKLLSSDDMWMFAPIAYNGMDIGLYRNISPTL